MKRKKNKFKGGHQCPLSVSLYFQSDSLEKIILEQSSEFALHFVGDSFDEEALLEWFSAYLQGIDRAFPIPLDLHMGPFQAKVLKQLQTIPFGQTRAYSEIAEAVESPNATRAVGTACKINPYPLVIPCHRVIAKQGGIGGFAYGAEMKESLLAFERNVRS